MSDSLPKNPLASSDLIALKSQVLKRIQPVSRVQVGVAWVTPQLSLIGPWCPRKVASESELSTFRARSRQCARTYPLAGRTRMTLTEKEKPPWQGRLPD